MHMSTQLVVKYIMWAGVEVKYEPFLGFFINGMPHHMEKRQIVGCGVPGFH